MKKYNIFLCYRGEASGLLAGSIFSDIQSYKNSRLKVFYAPRCIKYGADFVDICEKIAGEVNLMILFITKDFFNLVEEPDDVVGKEIRSALNNPQCKFLPILIKDLTFSDKDLSPHYSPEEIRRISHVNAIKYTDVYSFDSTQLLAPILEVLSLNKNDLDDDFLERTHISENKKGNFFSSDNKDEINRLAKQQKLLFNFDMPVYDKILKDKKDVCVLDLGSANGLTLMKRFKDRENVKKIIGIEYNENNVKEANEKYGCDRIKFYQGDVESDEFEELLEKILEEHDIEGFDFINILALISHLKNPSKMFKVIRRFCNRDSYILVRNIDDGLNLAFPDPNHDFKKALAILQHCTAVGYRYSGREIYTMLSKRGYKDIALERSSITTIGMDVDDKEAFFDTVFEFIRKGLEKEVTLHPESDDLAFMFKWYKKVYPELEDAFMDESFFFNFGFMIYTARVR